MGPPSSGRACSTSTRSRSSPRWSSRRLGPGDRRSTLIRTIVPPAVAVFVLLPHVYLNLRHPTGSPSNPAATPRNIAVMMAAGEGRLLAAMTALLAVGGSVWAWRFRDRRAIVALGAGWV